MDHVSKENVQSHNEELEKRVVQYKGQSDKLRLMSKELEETKATLSSHEDKLTVLTKRIDRLEKHNAILMEEIQDRRKENVRLLGELDKSRGQVKELSEKLTETELIWDEKLKELTVAKTELEDRLIVCTDLVEELQLLNEEMNPGAGEATDSNDEASEALPDFFGNPVIFNHILEQLPNSKLLELSLVSKLWKKEARIVMKRRGNVMALLESDDIRGCGQVLQAFAGSLQTSNETLYSGITIRFSLVYGCQGTGALELEAIQSILVGMRGKLKRLSIRLDYSEVCWNAQDYCSNFLLLGVLLRDFIGDLEHLKLGTQDDMEPFIQVFPAHGPYPKLKVLELNYDNTLTEEETFRSRSLIRMLLSRAPNLQEVHTKGCVSLMENLMEGREGVVYLHKSRVCDPMRDISEKVMPALRLKKMVFFYRTEPELKLDRFHEKAQSLLRICCTTTLKDLILDRVSLLLFMSYGIRLVNVNKLLIGFDYFELEEFEPRIQSIMARFDFTYFLPNVIKVGIGPKDDPMLPPDYMTTIIEQANNAVQKEPKVTRAGNIKSLGLFNYGSIPTSAFQFFAPIFPAIEKLESSARVEDALFGSAWELWPDLRLIEVEENKYQRP